MRCAPGRPNLLRRFAAMFYDSLLLFSILFLGTAAILPLYGGKAVPASDHHYPAYLLALSLLYFGWFWTHGGQTPGMKAWHMRVLSIDGGTPGWAQATVRFAAALLSWLACGAGFLWCLVDRDRRSWHDRLSRTVLVVEPVSRPDERAETSPPRVAPKADVEREAGEARN